MHYYKPISLELLDAVIMNNETLGRSISLFLGQQKDTTARSYEFPLRLLREHFGETRQLDSIKPLDLIEYFQLVVKPRGYAVSTSYKHGKTLRTYFNWCVKARLIASSPASALKVQRPRAAIDRSKAMRDDELARILAALQHKTNPRDYALVLFLADTGCRQGGATFLRLGDLDLEKRIATVTEKGTPPRRVAFSSRCAAALQKWFDYRKRQYQVKGDYVFSRNGLRPKDAKLTGIAVRRACKKAGTRSLGSHSLRHRKGHKLADARIAAPISAEVLGHADPKMTFDFYFPRDWERAERASREVMDDQDIEPSTSEVAAPPKIIPFPGRSA